MRMFFFPLEITQVSVACVQAFNIHLIIWIEIRVLHDFNATTIYFFSDTFLNDFKLIRKIIKSDLHEVSHSFQENIQTGFYLKHGNSYYNLHP